MILKPGDAHIGQKPKKPWRRACSTSLHLFELRFETLLNVLIFGMCLKPRDAHIGRPYSLLNGCLNNLLRLNLLINGTRTSSWVRFFEDFDEKTG